MSQLNSAVFSNGRVFVFLFMEVFICRVLSYIVTSVNLHERD